MQPLYKKPSLAFIFTILVSLSLCAQINPSGLKAGDTLPDYTLKNVLNYKTTTANFADFKGKLLILDFWSTYCSSCIASWPELLHLQKEYGDKIQILLMNTHQDTGFVKKIFAKRKQTVDVDMTLPAACGDTALSALFHVSGVPHIVWVNPEGLILSVSDGNYLNSYTLQKVLAGKVDMTPLIRSDDWLDRESNKPLFINGNGGTLDDISHLVGQSILVKGRLRLFPGKAIAANPQYNLYFALSTGYPISELYKLAYSDDALRLGHTLYLAPILANRFHLKTRDSSKYVALIHNELQPDNLYNYQLLSPPASLEHIQKMMQEDMKRYFGLKAGWKKEKRLCMVLQADDTTRIMYKTGPEIKKLDPFFVDLNHVAIKYFIQLLEQATHISQSPYPIVDETGFKGMLCNIKFETEMADYESLNRALKPFGLHFRLQERNIDVLVVSE